MDRALSEYVVNGIDTNISFLRRIVQHEAYKAGETTTGFIAQHILEHPPPSEARVDVAMIAAAIRQSEHQRELSERLVSSAPDNPGQEPGARWRQLGRVDAFRRFDFT